MVKSNLFRSAAEAALLAALVSGSAVMAQEAPVVVAQEASSPVVQAPVADVVAPPPAVRTLPSANDSVNAAAAEQAAAERKPAAATASRLEPKNSATRRASTSVPSNASVPAAPPSAPVTPIFNEPTAALPNSASLASPAASDEVASVVPPSTAADGAFHEDLTLFAGIAAALAAIGLGGLFAARRRRSAVPQGDYRPIMASASTGEAQPSFQAVAQPAVVSRPHVHNPAMSRPDIPVTDPLFGTPVHAAPISDPLFAPRNDVEIPITDPLFAKNARFNGRVRDGYSSMVREPVS